MISLDSCSQNILVFLADLQNPVSTQKIADEFGITRRIVNYRLRRVELWLGKNGFPLEKKPGMGIFLPLNPKQKQELHKILTSMPVGAVFLTPIERLQLLILTFLFSDQPIVIKQLEQKLNVSRTTILKDLEIISKWLSGKGLTLSRRPNFGCVIEGEERQIRNALVDAFIESLTYAFENQLVGAIAFIEKHKQKTQTAFRQQFLVFLEPLELRFFYHLATNMAVDNDLTFRELALMILVLNMAIATYRIRTNHQIDQVEIGLENLEEQRNLEIALQLVTAVQKRFMIRFSELSIVELIRVLHQCQERNPRLSTQIASIASLQEREQLKRDFDPAILTIVEQLLDRASIYLHPSLRVDTELILNLGNHLTNFYKFPGARMPMKNPLLADMKREYPDVFKVAQESVIVINQENEILIPEDEIGYIAMYLAAGLERMCIPLQGKKRLLVVCNAGGATASLLVSRIRTEFPDAEIMPIISFRELANTTNLHEYNLVISTIPLEKLDVPVVVVSPLLTEEDIRNIRERLRSRSVQPTTGLRTNFHPIGKVHLTDLIDQHTIRLKVVANNWEEVVEKAGEPLIALGAIEPGYVTAMKETINHCGPYMVIWPSVVLLHARPDEGVNRLCMSLITLKNAIPFGHSSNDPVQIAIVLGAVNNNSHLNALFELSSLMQKPHTIQSLINAATHFQVRGIVTNS